LERWAGHPVEVRVQIDPALMGGMAVAIGDTIIDGSVRRRLDRLRETLAPSHASQAMDSRR
jgi:F-type H+-transporting ATPase subunit delta